MMHFYDPLKHPSAQVRECPSVVRMPECPSASVPKYPSSHVHFEYPTSKFLISLQVKNVCKNRL